MFTKKLSGIPLTAKKPAPAPEALPVRSTLHVAAAPKTPLTAEDPQLLEKAMLRKMKRFGY